jgi:hypothetical protein
MGRNGGKSPARAVKPERDYTEGEKHVALVKDMRSADKISMEETTLEAF